MLVSPLSQKIVKISRSTCIEYMYPEELNCLLIPTRRANSGKIKNNLWHEFENNSILSVGKFQKNGKEKGIL